jgi:mRNA interferase MazF
VFPITTNVKKEVSILRVHLSEIESGLKKSSDILVDQVRAIDNRRFVKEIGKISNAHEELLVRNIKTLLFE